MHSVNLNTVNACVLEHLCALCECVNKLLDFLLSQGSRRNLIRPAVWRGACRSRDHIKIHKRLAENLKHRIGEKGLHHGADCERTAEACGKLNKKLCARLVELGHPLFEIIVHLLVLVQPLTEHRVINGLTAGENKSDVVLGDFHNELCAVFIEMVLFHPSEKVGAAHARQNYTVLDFAITDLPRRK